MANPLRFDPTSTSRSFPLRPKNTTRPDNPAQVTDPLQPGLQQILLQIGEKHAQLEDQLMNFKATVHDVATLQARAEQELDEVQKREDAWRTKVEEFAAVNKEWAAEYKALDRLRADLESQLKQRGSNV